MDWQQPVALMIVAATAGGFLWNRLRRRKSASSCGGSCACGDSKATPPRETITYRARKGERPQIIVKQT